MYIYIHTCVNPLSCHLPLHFPIYFLTSPSESILVHLSLVHFSLVTLYDFENKYSLIVLFFTHCFCSPFSFSYTLWFWELILTHCCDGSRYCWNFLYLWHVSPIYLTWLIHTCDMNHSCDSFIGLMWLAHARISMASRLSRSYVRLLQCIAVYCSVLQYVVASCSALQCAAVCCSAL